MNKNLLKTVIFDQHEVIKETLIVEREYEFDLNLNYVLVGLRRAGKSTLLYKIVKDLISKGTKWEQIIYINFEDDRLEGFTKEDFDNLLIVQSELSDKKGWFFFDEIQNIDGWERFARRMADSKEHVFITGSNSQMLSKEIEARLGGRYMTKYIMPYNFREFLKANSFEFKKFLATKEQGKIKRLFEQYLQQGGLPETVYIKDKREYLSNVYKKVLLGDIAYRNNIRNLNGLKFLIKKLAESVKDGLSYNKLSNILKSLGLPISKDSIIDYISYIKDACLLFPIYNFSAKFVERETSPKYYFEDNGILNLFLVDADSRLLENLVAIMLWTYYKEQVFYLKGTTFDIDFYVPVAGLVVQVAYSIKEISSNRETESIVKAAKQISGIKKAVIVTYDEEAEIKEEDLLIEVIPLWKLLLDETFTKTLNQKPLT